MQASKYILVFLVLIQCSPKQEDLHKSEIIKEYFNDGTLKAEYETIDSAKNGETRIYFLSSKLQFKLNYKNNLLEGSGLEYFENGKVKKNGTFSEGLLNGETVVYFENGNIALKGKFYNDLAVGKHIQYFEEKASQIKSVNEYLIFNNESKLNYFISYDLNGKIIGQSPHLILSQNGSQLEIRIVAKKFVKIKAIIGKYDRFFKLKENYLPDTTFSEDGMTIKMKFTGDTLRGYIDNYEALDSDRIISKHIWFSYPSQW